MDISVSKQPKHKVGICQDCTGVLRNTRLTKNKLPEYHALTCGNGNPCNRGTAWNSGSRTCPVSAEACSPEDTPGRFVYSPRLCASAAFVSWIARRKHQDSMAGGHRVQISYAALLSIQGFFLTFSKVSGCGKLRGISLK